MMSTTGVNRGWNLRVISLFFKSLFFLVLAATQALLQAHRVGATLAWCPAFSLPWLLLLQSTGARQAGFRSCGSRALLSTGSTVVAHGLTCSTARGIFPGRGSGSCLLHWQANSLPLSHQGSPTLFFLPFQLSEN